MTIKKYLSLKVVLVLTVLLAINGREAKAQLIDQIIATVGSNIVLQSEVDAQYWQYRLEGNIEGSENSIKCRILENLLFQKLLLNQAAIDSIEITDDQVESELERRLRYYILQFGSEEKFVAFYKKSVEEFKEEFREIVRDQLLQQKMEYEITSLIRITPMEVRAFFNDIDPDSLPYIEAEYEMAQILIIPALSEAELSRAKSKIQGIHDRIVAGESFETLASLYSDDPGSADNGGLLDAFGRGVMYPEFEAAAFSLKPGEISDVVETEAGYHILELISRKGEYVNVRHILIMPEVGSATLSKAKTRIDSIAQLIGIDSLSFSEAADKFSMEEYKNSGGIMLNPSTQTTTFSADDIDPSLFFIIDKMNVGDVSKPSITTTADGKKAYRILNLTKRTTPHTASLELDYDRIQTAALEKKKFDAISDWIREKTEATYINIIEGYIECEFEHPWIPK